MHERDVCSHRRQSYTFYTYYIHISCVFYTFLTHMYHVMIQGSTPSRALVLASSWVPRWQLAQRATSEERARKKRGTSAPVRQPSAVALSRCRQPLPSALSRCRQPLPSALSRCRQPLPSAVALSRQPLPFRKLGGGRWQARRLTAALLRLVGRRQARRLGASLWRLAALFG